MSQDNPLISIIMPTFNYSSYIGEAIDSVLKQTYSNWELIIVNDGSTDDTEKIVKKYLKKDKRIRYYKNEKNIGVAKSRQKGLDNSKGKFIGHLDSDDLLYPTAIDDLVEIIISKPKIKYIYSNFEDVDIKNTKILRTFIGPDKFSKDHIPGWLHFGMYEKKAAISVGGFNDFFHTCEDGYLAISLASKYKTYHVNKVLYKRRNHGKNVSYAIIEGCNKCNKYNFCPYIKKMNEVYLSYNPFFTFKSLILKLLKKN